MTSYCTTNAPEISNCIYHKAFKVCNAHLSHLSALLPVTNCIHNVITSILIKATKILEWIFLLSYLHHIKHSQSNNDQAKQEQNPINLAQIEQHKL